MSNRIDVSRSGRHPAKFDIGDHVQSRINKNYKGRIISCRFSTKTNKYIYRLSMFNLSHAWWTAEEGTLCESVSSRLLKCKDHDTEKSEK